MTSIKIVKSIWDSNIVRLLVTAYYVVSYGMMGVFLISITQNSDSGVPSWLLEASLFGLFVVPFSLWTIFGVRGNGAKWGRRAYNSIHVFTIIITGFSGVVWYTSSGTNLGNNALEPATFLLGLATAAITYNRDKYLKSIEKAREAGLKKPRRVRKPQKKFFKKRLLKV